MADERLKPCPFCGSKRIQLFPSNGEIFDDMWESFCWDCSARGPLGKTEKGIVRQWNRRKESENTEIN